jgi:hypothetical protein
LLFQQTVSLLDNRARKKFPGQEKFGSREKERELGSDEKWHEKGAAFTLIFGFWVLG